MIAQGRHAYPPLPEVDLVDLIGGDTRLHRVTGKELAGPCPWCGGTDRFRVNTERRLWWCRRCSPGMRWQSAADYVMRRDNSAFPEAADRLRERYGPAVPASGRPGDNLGDYTYHVYRDAGGRALCRKRRRGTGTAKRIGWERPHPGRPDSWLPGRGDAPSTLYHLPDLLAAGPDTTILIAEGELCCDALAALGHVAVTNPHGAGEWRPDYSPYLDGRQVVILPDCDTQGRAHATSVAGHVQGVATGIRILDLDPSRGDGHDVADWLQAGHTRAELDTLIAAAPAWGPPGAAGQPAEAGADARPVVLLGDNLPMLDGCLAALCQAVRRAAIPFLWWMAGQLVTVSGAAGTRRIHVVTPVDLGCLLARHARTMREGERGARPAKPTRLDLEHILAEIRNDPARIPAPGLLGLARGPFVDAGGRVVDINGYDPASRRYLDVPEALTHMQIPESPGPAEVAAARTYLEEAIIDEFSWADAPSRAHAWAALLTPSLFPALHPSANVPLFLVTKPASGSGASYFVQVLGALHSGVPARPQAVPRMCDTPEWTKQVLALLRAGTPVAMFDNVTEPLGNAVIEALLTSRSYSGRLLGTNEVGCYANDTTWIATGNNLRPREDTIRRVVHARIDTLMEHPECRAFARDPLADTMADRRRLLAALLTLVRAWFAAGRPPGLVPPFASYDAWAAMVGGILGHAGIAGFLGNRSGYRASVDDEGEAWAAFLAALHNHLQGESFKVGALLAVVTDPEGALRGHRFAAPALAQAAPPALRACDGQRRLQTHLGSALGLHVDRPHGGWVLRRVGHAAGSATYRVEACGTDLAAGPPIDAPGDDGV